MNDMVRDLEIAIHQFAKRQMTWFRGMERRGIKFTGSTGMLPMEEKVEYGDRASWQSKVIKSKVHKVEIDFLNFQTLPTLRLS